MGDERAYPCSHETIFIALCLDHHVLHECSCPVNGPAYSKDQRRLAEKQSHKPKYWLGLTRWRSRSDGGRRYLYRTNKYYGFHERLSILYFYVRLCIIAQQHSLLYCFRNTCQKSGGSVRIFQDRTDRAFCSRSLFSCFRIKNGPLKRFLHSGYMICPSYLENTIVYSITICSIPTADHTNRYVLRTCL